MQPTDFAPVRDQVRRFPQVLLQRRPDFSSPVGVKGKSALGKPAIIQAGWKKNALKNGTDVFFLSIRRVWSFCFRREIKGIRPKSRKRPVQPIIAEGSPVRRRIPPGKHAAGRPDAGTNFTILRAGGLGVIQPNESPAFRGAQGTNAVPRNTGAHQASKS